MLYLQGQTTGKPNALVVDVGSCNKPGMCYVMLSRVQCLDQLHIIKDLEPEKITVDKTVMKEAVRMWKVCVNRNPESWMDQENVKGLRVCCLNVRSLRKHIEDVRSDPVLQQADILFVQETWLTVEESEQEVYQLTGYRGFFASQGAGKGVGLYVRDGLPAGSITAVPLPHMQILKICLEGIDIISIYRSKEELPSSALHHIKNIISSDTDTLLIGDLNFCYCSEHNAISRYLDRVAFIWSVLFSILDIICMDCSFPLFPHEWCVYYTQQKPCLKFSSSKVSRATAIYSTGDQAHTHRWRLSFWKENLYFFINFLHFVINTKPIRKWAHLKSAVCQVSWTRFTWDELCRAGLWKWTNMDTTLLIIIQCVSFSVKSNSVENFSFKEYSFEEFILCRIF